MASKDCWTKLWITAGIGIGMPIMLCALNAASLVLSAKINNSIASKSRINVDIFDGVNSSVTGAVAGGEVYAFILASVLFARRCHISLNLLAITTVAIVMAAQGSAVRYHFNGHTNTAISHPNMSTSDLTLAITEGMVPIVLVAMGLISIGKRAHQYYYHPPSKGRNNAAGTTSMDLEDPFDANSTTVYSPLLGEYEKTITQV